jgi:hypothetical protein
MAEKHTFTYYLNIEVEAMNEESAMKKLEAWVEPTLALKKNSDLELTSVEYDEPEGEEEDSPTEERGSLVKSVMKRARPELKIPEKDDFDYDNIPDWEELEEEAAPKKAKSIVLEDTDDLDGLLDGLEDDPEEAGESEDDEDWDWDNESEW